MNHQARSVAATRRRNLSLCANALYQHSIYILCPSRSSSHRRLIISTFTHPAQPSCALAVASPPWPSFALRRSPDKRFEAFWAFQKYVLGGRNVSGLSGATFCTETFFRGRNMTLFQVLHLIPVITKFYEPKLSHISTIRLNLLTY